MKIILIHVGKKDELIPLNLLYDLRAEILQFEPCDIEDIELGTFTAIERSEYHAQYSY